MPGSIRSMQVEHVFRDVQTDRGSLLHGRLLRWQFDTVTLAHRCRRGASTPSPKHEPASREGAGRDSRCIERQQWEVERALVSLTWGVPRQVKSTASLQSFLRCYGSEA